ncbi:MAG: nickel-dependent hydrogenase large subunit [Anaerolineae bacterium]|nr:nickel-dependent hydrogenase large subunit [Anaerolineae bacterium]
MPTIRIDPVTRIEGHLEVEVSVETVDGVQQVIAAKSSGTMFRGFETILKGRDPRDATILTQRICGVCPVSHAMAATLTLESAFDISPPDNGRILRNLVLGANFIMSHILHFYHLAALDYIDTSNAVPMSPWQPQYITPDMVTGGIAADLVGHYVEALAMRRKAHQMGAIFGAKLPCVSTFVPGGCTEVVTAEKVADFRDLLGELRGFIDGVYVPDILTVAGAFPDYFSIGGGCGNLLAYGVFNLDAVGTKLLCGGRYTDGAFLNVDPTQIIEYVKHSRYTAASGNVNPSVGVTEPAIDKVDAYSWIKSPRYDDQVHEAGPLARMFVNYLAGESTVVALVDDVLDYFGTDPGALFSVLGRHAARAIECKVVADSMDGWLDELVVGGPVYEYSSIPESASGIGLTEAPRGALGHWIDISQGKIERYQVITPTAWNASPMDDLGEMGPMEQALIGTPVADVDQPIEVLRVVHSFDPCLACAVHLVTPEGQSLAEFRVS